MDIREVMKCFLFIMMALVVSDLHAEDIGDTGDVFVPASLKDSRSSLQNRINFPKRVLKAKNYGSVVVRCDSVVRRTGKFTHNFCYQEGKKAFPFVSAINRAAKGARINPGKVNGTARNVWFQYFVVFTSSEKGHAVEVIPNSGLEVGKYGYDYSSAQRYREGGGNFGIGCGINTEIVVKAIVDSFGRPSNIEVESEDEGDKCKRNIKQSFSEQEFIPAMVNGVAFKSFYSEEIHRGYREQ